MIPIDALVAQIRELIASLNLRRSPQVAILTGDAQTLSQELDVLITAVKKPRRTVVVMNEDGYNHSVSNKERYPFDKVWMVVFVGIFPHDRRLIKCGGDVQDIEEYPLPERVRKELENKLRLIGSGIVG